MGNLGRYQDIVVVAKQFGGVTFFLSAALTLGASKGPSWIKQARDRRQGMRHDAQLSEDDLRLVAEHSPDESEHNNANQLPVDQEQVSRDDVSPTNDEPPVS